MTTTTPAPDGAKKPGKKRTARPAGSAVERAAAAGARVPDDHQTSHADELRAEVLGETPEGTELLRPPHQLRARERAALLKITVKMLQDFQVDQETIDRVRRGGASLDEQAELGTVSLELVADFDDALEAVAIDRDAYGRWATREGGPEPERRISELFMWYSNTLGE